MHTPQEPRSLLLCRMRLPRGNDSLLDEAARITLTATLTSYIIRIKRLFLVIHKTKSTSFTKHCATLIVQLPLI
jgi:hypothetical protein